MKSVFDFRFNIYIIGLTISSIIERTVTFLINNYTILKLDPNGIGYHALSLVILIALFLLSNVVLKAIVHKDFVSKLAWKKQYVSGQWVEVIVNEKNEVSHITNMEIECDISEIVIHGECHLDPKPPKYISNYTFNSVCSKFDNDRHTLHYAFIQKGVDKDPEPFYGYLDFLSTQKKGQFDKYIGGFYDGENHLHIYAIKINNKDKNLVKNLGKYFKKTAINEVLPEIQRVHGLAELRVPESFLAYQEKTPQLK